MWQLAINIAKLQIDVGFTQEQKPKFNIIKLGLDQLVGLVRLDMSITRFKHV